MCKTVELEFDPHFFNEKYFAKKLKNILTTHSQLFPKNLLNSSHTRDLLNLFTFFVFLEKSQLVEKIEKIEIEKKREKYLGHVFFKKSGIFCSFQFSPILLETKTCNHITQIEKIRQFLHFEFNEKVSFPLEKSEQQILSLFLNNFENFQFTFENTLNETLNGKKFFKSLLVFYLNFPLFFHLFSVFRNAELHLPNFSLYKEILENLKNQNFENLKKFDFSKNFTKLFRSLFDEKLQRSRTFSRVTTLKLIETFSLVFYFLFPEEEIDKMLREKNVDVESFFSSFLENNFYQENLKECLNQYREKNREIFFNDNFYEFSLFLGIFHSSQSFPVLKNNLVKFTDLIVDFVKNNLFILDKNRDVFFSKYLFIKQSNLFSKFQSYFSTNKEYVGRILNISSTGIKMDGFSVSIVEEKTFVEFFGYLKFPSEKKMLEYCLNTDFYKGAKVKFVYNKIYPLLTDKEKNCVWVNFEKISLNEEKLN